MIRTYCLVANDTLPGVFVLRRFDDDGQLTGAKKIFESSVVARACDDIEQQNHMEETYGDKAA